MTMTKVRGNLGHGELVQIKCRRCGADVTISVIALSRLHHPPVCDTCTAAAKAELNTPKESSYVQKN